MSENDSSPPSPSLASLMDQQGEAVELNRQGGCGCRFARWSVTLRHSSLTVFFVLERSLGYRLAQPGLSTLTAHHTAACSFLPHDGRHSGERAQRSLLLGITLTQRRQQCQGGVGRGGESLAARAPLSATS